MQIAISWCESPNDIFFWSQLYTFGLSSNTVLEENPKRAVALLQHFIQASHFVNTKQIWTAAATFHITQWAILLHLWSAVYISDWTTLETPPPPSKDSIRDQIWWPPILGLHFLIIKTRWLNCSPKVPSPVPACCDAGRWSCDPSNLCLLNFWMDIAFLPKSKKGHFCLEFSRWKPPPFPFAGEELVVMVIYSPKLWG